MVSPPKYDQLSKPDLPGIKNKVKEANKVLKGPSRLAKPPTPRREPILPLGPKWIEIANTDVYNAGPGEPPPGFVTSHTSRTEWIAYWALAKIFGNPIDPRKFPYIGGFPDWGYQVGLDGTRANAVVDFMINRSGQARRLGIRIQTGYFHYGKGSDVIAFDESQLVALLKYIDVVDVPDTELLGDRTGQKAIVTMKTAMGSMRFADPVKSGTVHRGG